MQLPAVAGLFVLSLLVGAWSAWPLLESTTSWWQQAPCRLESISVQGNERMPAEEVAAATGVERSCSFADLDLAAVEERLATHPWIRTARATRLPVGQLLIEVDERVPVAVLLDTRTRAWHLVDADGTLFARADAEYVERLPRLRTTTTLERGRAHPVLVEAIEVAARADRLGLAVFGGEPELELPGPGNEGWVLDFTELPLRAVLGRVELSAHLDRLAQLLGSGLPEVREAKVIDLRFSGHAVLRSSASG